LFEEPGLRTDVERGPAAAPRERTVPPPKAARQRVWLLAAKDDVRLDDAEDVPEDVLLNGAVEGDVRAHVAPDLVPWAPHRRTEEAIERSEVVAEPLGPVAVPAHRLAARMVLEVDAMATVEASPWIAVAAVVPRPLDGDLGHVRAHGAREVCKRWTIEGSREARAQRPAETPPAPTWSPPSS